MDRQHTNSYDAPRQINNLSQRSIDRSVQLFKNHIPIECLLLGLFEFTTFFLALYAAVYLRFEVIDNSHGSYKGSIFPDAVLFSVAMSLAMMSLGAYQRSSNQHLLPMIVRIAQAMLLAVVPLSLLFYLSPMLFMGRGVMGLATVISFIGTVLIRIFFYRIHQTSVKPRILVLGTGKNARLVWEAQKKGELNSLNIQGYCAIGADSIEVNACDIIDNQNSLIDIVERFQPDQIVVAADDRRKALPMKDILDCKMSGYSVIDLLTFFERETGKIRLDILTPSWLYLSEGFRHTSLKRFGKRLFDIAASGLLLIITAPLMLLVACCIHIEGGCKSPVIYRQMRVGRNGVQFEILKFRSMLPDAESDGVARWAQPKDSRVTKVGTFIRKARLDELPQLFNILRGEMSIVGPRPERSEFTRQLALTIPYYNERHRVKPGLTGWAQIRFNYGASAEDATEKLQYDLYYTKNYGLIMDMLIILQTVEVVLMGKGAR